jgi:diaminopimelate decarboxylase
MSTPAPKALTHAPHPYFTARGDDLVVGDTTVAALARRVGRTPFYAYSRTAINARVAELRNALPRDVHLHYAMKANPAPAVVGHFVPLVDGIDVASAAEMHVALDAGASPEHVSLAGPGKTDSELSQAHAAGIIVNVESRRELAVLDALGRATGRRARVAIRVNPDFELKASGMKMSGGPKQFGIDAEIVPEVLREMAVLAVEFVGFHIYSGSQNLRPEAIVEAQQKSFALACTLAREAPAPVKVLNLGGGFGIPYFPGDPRLVLDAIDTNLRELATAAKSALPDAQLVVELGRFLVGEAGVYVCRVIDRKVSRGHVFLVTDGGLHHHLAASGNFGQVVRKNYPVAVANRMASTDFEVASVVGPLCTPLDLLADRVQLPRADVGDLVAVLQSGAYGLTASPLAFLSHPRPAEVLV